MRPAAAARAALLGLVAAVAQPRRGAEPPPQSATRPPAESPEAPRTAKPDSLAEPPDTLDFQPVRDGVITGLGLTFWVLEETVLKDAFAPDRCRWCDRGGDGADTLNGLDANFRDLVRWNNVTAPDTASDITTYVLSPVIAFGMGALAAGREGRLHEWRENSLEVMEAMVLATAVNKLTKVAFARKRPYAHFRHRPDPARRSRRERVVQLGPYESRLLAGGRRRHHRDHPRLQDGAVGLGHRPFRRRGDRLLPHGRRPALHHRRARRRGDRGRDRLGGPVVPGPARHPATRAAGACTLAAIELRDGGAVLGVNFVH